MGFGRKIQEIRINKGYTLRSFFKILKSKGFKKDISQYSKIEREIQNPQNKEEFDFIISSLEIDDKELIKNLELAAQKFIPEKEVDEKTLIPAFLPPHIKTKDQLDDIIENIKQAYKPDFSED